MRQSQIHRLGDALNYLAFALIIAFFLTPLLWAGSLSIRTPDEVYLSDVRLIPRNPTLANYAAVFANPQFVPFLLNGLQYALAGAIGAMLVASPAAYAFSRLPFRGRNAMLIGVLALQMISPLVIMIPLYRYFHGLGLLNTRFGVSMVYVAVAVPIFTWMLKGFLDAIPKALDEAAMIDGCTRFGAFARVTLPLSLPGLTSAFLLTAIMGWSEFVIPFILMSDPSKLPISVGIYNFQATFGQATTQIVAAASVMAILPALVLFVALQRFIISALLAGAVKG